MSGQVSPVTFPNQVGARLHGVIHVPECPESSRPAVLLLSPGVKMRVAPHRLYLAMAERFVALGYVVLRFDFHGLGDSEGQLHEDLLADLYGAIQMGRYVGDTIAAMDWMQRTYGTTKFIGSGLCGGAITALLAADRDLRLVGLLGLAIPVVLDGANVNREEYMTTAELRGTRDGYLRKLRIWEPQVWHSWARLLTFKSDHRMIARSLFRPLLSRMRPRLAESAPESPLADNTNPRFAPALLRVLTSRKVLLIFAEADRLYWEFEAKFVERHRQALERHSANLTLHVTRQANHVFSLPDAQQDMLNECCRWLVAHQNTSGRQVSAPAMAAAR